jgi:prevent-host-death family protein
MRSVTASELKAKCLGILDQVSRTGEPVIVTKRGRPVARLVPAGPDGAVPSLAGTVEIVGDILSPVLPAAEWEAEGGGEE